RIGGGVAADLRRNRPPGLVSPDGQGGLLLMDFLRHAALNGALFQDFELLFGPAGGRFLLPAEFLLLAAQGLLLTAELLLLPAQLFLLAPQLPHLPVDLRLLLFEVPVGGIGAAASPVGGEGTQLGTQGALFGAERTLLGSQLALAGTERALLLSQLALLAAQLLLLPEDIPGRLERRGIADHILLAGMAEPEDVAAAAAAQPLHLLDLGRRAAHRGRVVALQEDVVLAVVRVAVRVAGGRPVPVVSRRRGRSRRGRRRGRGRRSGRRRAIPARCGRRAGGGWSRGDPRHGSRSRYAGHRSHPCRGSRRGHYGNDGDWSHGDGGSHSRNTTLDAALHSPLDAPGNPTLHTSLDSVRNPFPDTVRNRAVRRLGSHSRLRRLPTLRGGHGHGSRRRLLGHDPDGNQRHHRDGTRHPPPAGNPAPAIGNLLQHLKSPFEVLERGRGTRGGETGLARSHTPAE